MERYMSRAQIETRGWHGRRIINETDSTYTVRVLDSFNLTVLKADQSLTPCLVNDGFWEAWISSWLTHNLQPGMTFLDIGANCGYYTMLAERLVGEEGCVVAYEPNPVYTELLRATRESNDAKFLIREVALSDRAGRATLTVPGEFHGSASITTDFAGTSYHPNPYNVRTTTLDNELQRIVFWDHDVIKIDAEGAEQLVWDGAREVRRHSPSTLMLEYTPGAYTPRFLDELFEWGEVSAIDFGGGEYAVTREYIESQTDWLMLVIRRK